MSIKKESILAMARALKLDITTVEAAMAADTEQELTLPAGISVLSADDLILRDKTVKKQGYDEGSVASVEMLVKDQKREFGLEFEGKDPAKLLVAFKSKVLSEANIEPVAALKEKDDMINGLRTNITRLETEKTELSTQTARVRTEAAVLRSVPINLKAGFEPDEVMLTMRSKGYEFEEKDGVITVKKGGTVVAHPTSLQPLPVADVIKSYVTERGWLDEGAAGAGAAGRGGAHSKGAGAAGTVPTNLEQATKLWKEAGKNAGTADFQRHIDGLMKDNKDFSLDTPE